MYKKLVKILSIILIFIGTITSFTIFGFKIFFYENDKTVLVTLEPDNVPAYSVPKDKKGYNVKNLDIDILNKKEIENVDQQLRPLPVEPELLPIESNEKKIEIKPNDKVKVKKNIIKNKDKLKNTKKAVIKKTNLNIGMYRVQLGSFRDLYKADVAIKSIKKKYANLLKDIDLKRFSYTNNQNIVYHRVWTSSLKKAKALNLCNQFKLKNMVCILKVVR